MNKNLNLEGTTINNESFEVIDRLNDKMKDHLLFEDRQIRVSCAKFKVTCFIDFGPFLNSFESLENYTIQLVKQLANLEYNDEDIQIKLNQSFLAG